MKCRSSSPRATRSRRTSGCFFANERTAGQFDLAAFYTFRDGRIAQIREVMDTFDLVEQVLERDVAAVLIGKKLDEL